MKNTSNRKTKIDLQQKPVTILSIPSYISVFLIGSYIFFLMEKSFWFTIIFDEILKKINLISICDFRIFTQGGNSNLIDINVLGMDSTALLVRFYFISVWFRWIS